MIPPRKKMFVTQMEKKNTLKFKKVKHKGK